MLTIYETGISIFYKCLQNFTNGKINIHVPLPPINVHKVWVAVRQILKILRKQYQTLIGMKLFKTFLYMKKLNL